MYKEETNVDTEKRRVACRIYKGSATLTANRTRRVVIMAMIAILTIVECCRFVIASSIGTRYEVIMQCLMAVLLGLIVCYLVSNPLRSTEIEQGLYRAGIVNSAGEPPILLSMISEESGAYRMIFLTNGIPILEWKDNQASIEGSLNVVITRISQGRNRRTIEIICMNGSAQFPTMIPFEETRFGLNDSELLLGVDIAHHKSAMDLSVVPHALIGGATGSGKTILLKSLLIQAINKGMNVVVIDLKGGADYSEIWNEKALLLLSHADAQSKLQKILEEMENRKSLFHSEGTKDINAYNDQHVDKIRRVVIGCDEIADLLAVKGLSKEEKETVQDITAMLSKIARQGRAFGIHLLLATQRPDADVLNGQIKSNMGLRICGRANDMLSRIILDDDSASELIPSDAQGLFIDQDGLMFKSPYCTDEDLEKGGRYEGGTYSSEAFPDSRRSSCVFRNRN